MLRGCEAAAHASLPVLDAGCGTGLSGEALAAAGFRQLVGVDVSSEMLRLCEAKRLYNSLTSWDLEGSQGPLPFIDDSFSAVVCVGVLSYVQLFEKVYKEWCRVVAPGGHVIFTHRDTLWDANVHSCRSAAASLQKWRLIQSSEPEAYMPATPAIWDHQRSLNENEGLAPFHSLYGNGEEFTAEELHMLRKSAYEAIAYKGLMEPGDVPSEEAFVLGMGLEGQFCLVPAEEVEDSGTPGQAAKNAPGQGAPGYIYDFVGGGVPVGPETLAVGPSQTSGDSMKRPTFGGSGLMRYSLEVEICSSRGLRNADWMTLGVGGTSDPYCICQVIGAGKTEFRTKTIDNTVEPVWKELSNVDDFFEGDVLLFRVYDEDRGKEDDFLGQVELPTCSVLPNGFRGELRLRKTSADGSDSQEAYLTVAVAILDSHHDPTPHPICNWGGRRGVLKGWC
ncbi:METTL27 [Symbiodinium microadriaticum]|nr:METTL27 [Symbiodinium microadriaticum]